jgi:magnesium transporter
MSEREDQEAVALHAIRHGQDRVPLVDGAGRLAGVVMPDALLRILRAEHVEDLHRMAGIRPAPKGAPEPLDGASARRAADRLPWLLVGLAGSAVATWLMSSYEDALVRRVALGSFVPGIVYLADAIGTQSEALAVRALSHRRVRLRELLVGEFVVGLMIGGVLAALSFGGIWSALGDGQIAIIWRSPSAWRIDRARAPAPAARSLRGRRDARAHPLRAIPLQGAAGNDPCC